MKRINKNIFAALIVVSVACASCFKSVFPVRGSGDLSTSERIVSPFAKISSAGCAEIRFHASDEYRAVVTIDANLDGLVDVYAKNNILVIRPKAGYNVSPTKFLVDVYCPTLNGVSMSGSSRFTAMDMIVASSFDASISGSGRLEGSVECEKFSAKISGSGRITVDGSAERADIAISGSGNLNGSDLMIKNATVNISGSGNVNIFVTDFLKARISGSGRISYRGEPKIDSSVSGSGRIRKM